MSPIPLSDSYRIAFEGDAFVIQQRFVGLVGDNAWTNVDCASTELEACRTLLVEHLGIPFDLHVESDAPATEHADSLAVRMTRALLRNPCFA
jgi:hypothetical protein